MSLQTGIQRLVNLWQMTICHSRLICRLNKPLFQYRHLRPALLLRLAGKAAESTVVNDDEAVCMALCRSMNLVKVLLEKYPSHRRQRERMLQSRSNRLWSCHLPFACVAGGTGYGRIS